MGATRFCFLLFCFFLMSVSSPVTKRNNICLPRPRPQGRNQQKTIRSYNIKDFIKKKMFAPAPTPTLCLQLLDNIADLTNTNYGKPSPRHGLQLLFWFTQKVDQNNLLKFDPARNDFGFHHFRNDEHLFPQLNDKQKYYEVGNLNYHGASKLPMYVKKEYFNRNNDPKRNMDRLVISLDKNKPQRIYKVFITSHSNKKDFNPSDTYEIAPALISQIRTTNCNNAVVQPTSQDYKEEEKRCNLFLTETKANDCKKSNAISTTTDNPRKKRSPYSQCNTYEGIIEIKTTTQGYTKLIWKNLPADIMKKYSYVYIDIIQNTPSSDPNKDPTQVSKYSAKIRESSGFLETSFSLNAGLQPRLRLYTYYVSANPVIWNGPEFDGANRVIPIRIKGIDASLQLYALNGYACARLYIRKTFSNWMDVLANSWVGFYKSSQDKNNDYSTYQYAVKFAKIEDDSTKDYDIYKYKSGSVIAPGVQIRFFLDKKYNNVLARTTPWESDEKVTSTCDKGNPELSSYWSDPEFFYEPEFYDANNVLPTKIQTYDAGLQLFTQDGKACARLYIKKTFTDWKNTFYYSWVGFYISSQKTNDGYKTYQYAVNFEKMQDGTKHFDVYQYKSTLAIAPGVQIRFLKDKGYDKTLVKTEAWN